MCGGWWPGTLMFGAVDGLQAYLAGIPDSDAGGAAPLFAMLPYLATLVALAVLARSRAGPARWGGLAGVMRGHVEPRRDDNGGR